MFVDSVRDQATSAVLPNPYAANYAIRPPSPVSLQPTEGTKTANTGASDGSGIYITTTQQLAQATLLALRQQSTSSANSSVTSGSTLGTAQREVLTKTGVANGTGTYTHLPKANSGVNAQLTLSDLNSLPQFQTFMSHMFATLNTIDQIPSASKTINSLNKNSITGLTSANNNYYHQGYDQNSYDLLSSKLNYLAVETKKALELPSPSLTKPVAITPGQKSPVFSKDAVSAPAPNTDNQVTNPHIQKLNESFSSLVSSLHGNVGESSLASFVQNLQHQAHGFSASGNVVNTSA